MKISVVIPLYNKSQTILRAVASVERQKMLPVEILVINDGSTDGSEKLVESLKDEKIRVISQPNTGVSAARNKGIHEASCEWIAFLDADDEWEEDFLEIIGEMYHKHQQYHVFATAYYSGNFKGEKRKIKLQKLLFSGRYGVMSNYFEVASYSSPPICSSAVCIRKSELKKIGGFPTGYKAGEDLLTWARLAARKSPVYCIEPKAVFWKEKSHTYEDIPKRIPEINDPVGQALIELKKESGSLYLEKYIALWFKMRASIYLRMNMRYHAFGDALKSLKYNPFNIRVFAYLLLCGMPNSIVQRMFRNFGE